MPSFAQQGYSPDEWEQATLVLRRTGYQINFSHKDEVFIEEKYSPNLQVHSPTCTLIDSVMIAGALGITDMLFDLLIFISSPQAKIPNGRTTQFVLVSSGGVNIPFNTQGITEPNNEDNDVRYNYYLIYLIFSLAKTSE
jgi:hypothetical protein